MRMYGRRRQLTAEETAANAAARAKRNSATMTCQCCARKYLANRGWVAHHAYERPGEGWQTASCMGAKALPFETNRDELGRLIVILTGKLARKVEYLGHVETEQVELPVSFTDKRNEKDNYGRRASTTVHVKGETFDAIRAENSEHALHGTFPWSFDDVKERWVSTVKRDIESLTLEIKAQQTRYDGWMPTHRWEASTETWVAL